MHKDYKRIWVFLNSHFIIHLAVDGLHALVEHSVMLHLAEKTLTRAISLLLIVILRAAKSSTIVVKAEKLLVIVCRFELLYQRICVFCLLTSDSDLSRHSIVDVAEVEKPLCS